MSAKIKRTVIAFEPKEILDLEAIVTDQDEAAALSFLINVIGEKLRCAQSETHRPAFEGGTGHEDSHYQKDH